MISRREIDNYHGVLKMACDPTSPFYGKVGLKDLLKLPLEDQNKIYSTMNPGLKKLVDAFALSENKKVTRNA